MLVGQLLSCLQVRFLRPTCRNHIRAAVAAAATTPVRPSLSSAGLGLSANTHTHTHAHRTAIAETQRGCPQKGRVLAAQKSHRKIAVTTVATSGLRTIPLPKSQCFSHRRPQKNRNHYRFLGYLKTAGSSQQPWPQVTAAARFRARSDHGTLSHGGYRNRLGKIYKGNQTIYLHRSGPLLENGLD